MLSCYLETVSYYPDSHISRLERLQAVSFQVLKDLRKLFLMFGHRYATLGVKLRKPEPSDDICLYCTALSPVISMVNRLWALERGRSRAWRLLDYGVYEPRCARLSCTII